MNHALSPTVRDIVQEFMATGGYASEDELLLEALSALRQRREEYAALAASIADMEAGHVRPFEEVADEIRRKHGFPANA